MELDRKLKNIQSYPFHMPGHKRNKCFDLPSSDIDITEISGFDNLHNPKDIVKQIQEQTAELFGYKKSIISVNGSTCCVLAAISAVCSRGDKIIIARNCHKSVYNACYINELDTVYIEPEYNSEYGFWGRVSQESVDRAIAENPEAKALVITSPTYEGFVSNIKCGITLIVDNAHGAHFGFADWLPQRQNGDIIIQSLHKTLPCLTQTAVIHINNGRYYDSVRKYMDIFETSSPSYVLLDSVDKCMDFLKDSRADFEKYKKRLFTFYQEAKKIEGIHIIKNDDITRIVLSADSMNGAQLAQFMREKYAIESECAGVDYVILISTVADSDNGFEKLLNSLKNIGIGKKRRAEIPKPVIPVKKCLPCDVGCTAETELEKSENLICAETVFAYPPGVPIIIAGEVISRNIIDYINKLFHSGVNVMSDSALLPLKILTKK